MKLPGFHLGNASLIDVIIRQNARVFLAIHDPNLNVDRFFKGKFVTGGMRIWHIRGPYMDPWKLDMRARVHKNARVIELAASLQGPLRLRRGSRGVRASAFARQKLIPTSNPNRSNRILRVNSCALEPR
jgi:hypothetical protein